MNPIPDSPAPSEEQDHRLRLSWPRPAAVWNEAAPVGNGRLGAMVFGGAHSARIQINDSTVWSGTPGGPAAALEQVLARGAGPERLAEVREALRKQDHATAEALLMDFQGDYSQEYLPYADLLMTLGADGEGPGEAAYLGRTLDLDDGVVEEELELDGLRVRRLTWASAPAGALCVSLAVEGGRTDLRLALTSPLRVVHSGYDHAGGVLGVEIPVDGAPSHEPSVAEPLRYADAPVDGYDPYGAVALSIATDGRVGTDEGGWSVQGMSYALLTFASSTSAADHWAGRRSRTRQEHRDAAAATASDALALGADELLRGHRADLRALLGSAELTIGPRRAGTFDVERDVLGGGDELLTATVLFQLGRYLLASASRPGAGPPANLQGIWNADLRPAWSSNYTVNINTQMNYWGAEAAGLGPCHEPLFDLLDRLARTGGPVARELYGARGWVTHHNTDMWGWALPVGMGHGNPSWAIWMTGGVWLSQHLWDHYEFTRDTGFLRDRAWPVLRGAALFCLDWLVDDGNGFLDTLPGTSPENLFRAADGGPRSLTRSPAMDSALIRALFERTLRTAELLGLDDDPVTAEIGAALPRLRPPLVSAGGWLQEWAEDLPEVDPTHRHLSQMVAVHPLGQIDPDATPELAAAALRLMDRRGPGAMGWSWAWKTVLRARLRDAATARALFLEASGPLAADPDTDAAVDGSQWGGLLPNLFSTHPPFQIDGNYGLMAALTEMVLQSHAGTVHLLPALPAEWPQGRARGLRCRGGVEVDFAWSGGVPSLVTVRRVNGDGAEPVLVRFAERTVTLKLAVGEQAVLDAGLREVPGEVTAPC
ncbi:MULTISPECIES: glycosyl hydrolase family 95 catalytic domain-containing protein [Streptacidiphilus]|uniref:Glycoside hydrolase N-terminal domain-containing protein n=1 Tax=Streptacidiphilus cavernicola TaxID=3342716 RepID=A0ABV6UJJ3_9ACTN|nr:glycoside hydrolase N-terminal domain-containing protein [Streptacidiphilus jeojiense]